MTRFLGAAVRRARKLRRLTQEQVAVQIEVSVEFYARIERGVARPSIEVFRRMVTALGVSADVLLGIGGAGAVVPHVSPAAPPETRELMRLLRRAQPATLRLMSALLHELERAEAIRKCGRVATEPWSRE